MLTIGAVRDLLAGDFPDITISKIRYLERRGLLKPGRTPAGYRLYDESDIERLRRVLELQREEYLPLRVIREELAGSKSGPRRRRGLSQREREPELDLSELCRRAQVTPELVSELEDQGLLRARPDVGERFYSADEATIAQLCGRIVARGMDVRHLRSLRHASERVSGLAEQVMAPGLFSHNSERRREATTEMEELIDQLDELVRLLVWRDLRDLVRR